MPEITRTWLAKRIRLLRVSRGWSQADLAERSGVHRNYIGYVERGQVNMGLENVGKIAQAFGISMQDLLELNPGEPVAPIPPRSPRKKKT